VSLGDILGLLRLSPETSVALVALLLGLAFWRWRARLDAGEDDARLSRHAQTSAEMAELRKRIEALSARVQNSATKEDLRHVEDDLRALQSDVRANWTELKGALAVVQEKLSGQRDILMRIDAYLLERDK